MVALWTDGHSAIENEKTSVPKSIALFFEVTLHTTF